MSSSSVVTLANIRSSAKQRADMVNSSFISDSEWNGMITNSYKELYDLLVTSYGNDYYAATPYSFTTDGTNQLFALPSDFYKLLGVDLKVSARWISLKPFAFADRNRTGVSNPIPSAGQQLQLWYVPEPTNLVNDADTLDGISGWEEMVIVDAAIKAGIKEETDVSALQGIKNALGLRIQAAAQNRDAGMPATVVDSARRRSDCGIQYRITGNQIWLVQRPNYFGSFDPEFGEAWGY